MRDSGMGSLSVPQVTSANRNRNYFTHTMGARLRAQSETLESALSLVPYALGLE